MKQTILAALLLTATVLNLPAMASPLAHLWSSIYGDANAQVSSSVATDASGNVYITGRFYGSVDFGGGDLTATGAGAEIFLAKFDASGAYLWSQGFGDASDQNSYSVQTDAAGNVYIGGFFQGAVNFGDSLLTSAGDRDIFIAKFNSAGTHQWSKRFGDLEEQWCLSIAVDAAGNVYATGYFLGSVDFGGGALVSTGSYQIFLAKFDSAGAHQWSAQFGDPADQRGLRVATDASGNAYMAGIIVGTVNFGGGDLTSAGGFDIFLAKFDASGAHEWSQRFGDTLSQQPNSVAIGPAGDVYMTGSLIGSADFGGGIITSAGSLDVFLAKFDASGAHQWSRRWGDTGSQYGISVAPGPLGDVYLAGDFDGTVNFGGDNLTGAGGTDFFLARFDAAGAHQWSQRYGDPSKYQGVSCATADASNNVYITGYFEGTADFGGGLLTSTGSFDAFLAKFGTVSTGVHDSPMSDALSITAYPNPFNPGTTVRYTLPSKGRVAIAVYDLRGVHVATLVDREMDAGAHVVEWDGRDDRGHAAGSGVYFARLTSPAGSRSYKMTLLK